MSYNNDDKEEVPPQPKKEMKSMKATSSRKMTDQQKKQLKTHMDKLDMSPSEKKSHRMKLMSQMRRGKSVKAAHKAVMG